MATDRRQAICDWLAANGIDPNYVPRDTDLTIETDDRGQRLIKCEAFVRQADGSLTLDEHGTDAARETRTVPLTVEPPEWWKPHVKPTRDELIEQLAAVRAELDALHQGEETYRDEATVPTPAQWIWRWTRLTPEKRLEVAAHLEETRSRAGRCFFENHDATIAELRSQLSARTGT